MHNRETVGYIFSSVRLQWIEKPRLFGASKNKFMKILWLLKTMTEQQKVKF